AITRAVPSPRPPPGGYFMFRPCAWFLLLVSPLGLASAGCRPANQQPAAGTEPRNASSAPNVVAQVRVQAHKETAEAQQTLDFKTDESPRVAVDLFQGSITVSPAKENKVTLQVTRKAFAKTKEAAEAHLKDIQVEGKAEKDGVRITATREARDD